MSSPAPRRFTVAAAFAVDLAFAGFSWPGCVTFPWGAVEQEAGLA
ncbi:hypothetical protein SAMN02982929_03078 [Saccharopolyspora kobensis]|uniref:Uncharacterized protein n=1 Tax=Saccharopolyspora kobensis TaxID=146035 RepID=A0A1H6C3A8_9PSEU|nr:hypothetical protein SAMN02982929_03078 [Saccharopolyspora kobensis]SFC26111.1 hypothetical protein SAMN05216506_101318 [Saccharopolyspora kobensis]